METSEPVVANGGPPSTAKAYSTSPTRLSLSMMSGPHIKREKTTPDRANDSRIEHKRSTASSTSLAANTTTTSPQVQLLAEYSPLASSSISSFSSYASSSPASMSFRHTTLMSQPNQTNSSMLFDDSTTTTTTRRPPIVNLNDLVGEDESEDLSFYDVEVDNDDDNDDQDRFGNEFYDNLVRSNSMIVNNNRNSRIRETPL